VFPSTLTSRARGLRDLRPDGNHIVNEQNVCIHQYDDAPSQVEAPEAHTFRASEHGLAGAVRPLDFSQLVGRGLRGGEKEVKNIVQGAKPDLQRTEATAVFKLPCEITHGVRINVARETSALGMLRGFNSLSGTDTVWAWCVQRFRLCPSWSRRRKAPAPTGVNGRFTRSIIVNFSFRCHHRISGLTRLGISILRELQFPGSPYFGQIAEAPRSPPASSLEFAKAG
jgi:hypothetical protein